MMREKLIELIDSFNRDLSQFAGNSKYFIVDDHCELADHLIANGVTVQEKKRFLLKENGDLIPLDQQWISVKDRLPKGAKQGETSENVIAYTIDGEVTTGWLDALGSDKWWLVIGTDDTHTCWGLGYVTHWMPLPEPPKEDDYENND